MTARNENQAEAVKLLPCPFCKAEMDGDRTYWTHPENDCILSEFEFDGWRKGDDDADDDSYGIQAAHEWNRRALAAPASGQGVVESFADHWGCCGFVPEGANPDHIYAAMKSGYEAGIEARASRAGSASRPEPTHYRVGVAGEWFYGTKEACQRERQEFEADTDSPHEDPEPCYTTPPPTNSAMPAQQADSGDAKDAARYRFLKNGDFMHDRCMLYVAFDSSDEDELDAAIDAAMSPQGDNG